ncbi:hypothetical protein C7M61_002639 [Candidozyma pseudohaemuli]|uniref:GTP:AMP phosphotransferase, mitochondrial n=1 Tax=Candidozyma pseudohaemuli TaxID=418784 RepID=A0A2P7YRU9_9ASCO|nr:hypothetical protein C7M61_002639 [[Candida] pseudohaemulonii]PSK38700.1 hypothetical protein C7M61_002639 [[Candida] pseudohaemulonii]
MVLARQLRLLLLGAPGAGKGTQTSRLVKAFPTLNALSSGDILRAEVARGTPLGLQASKLIEEGKLVPDDTMVGVIKNHLLANDWLNGDALWLLDGFPRTGNQARDLDKVLKENRADINLVVELEVDQKSILERVEARWIHPASGRVYNLDYNPPKEPYKDDETGEKLEKRKDDTKEVFGKRLDKYNEEILTLREYYQKKGIWHGVAGETSDIIFPKIKDLILKKFDRP